MSKFVVRGLPQNMTDEEFDNWLPIFLRAYIKGKLQPIETVVGREKFPEMEHLFSEPQTGPALAAVIPAYSSLETQRKQGRMNLVLQGLILLLAGVNIIAILLPYFLPHSS